jgi:hypothetical protein
VQLTVCRHHPPAGQGRKQMQVCMRLHAQRNRLPGGTEQPCSRLLIQTAHRGGKCLKPLCDPASSQCGSNGAYLLHHPSNFLHLELSSCWSFGLCLILQASQCNETHPIDACLSSECPGCVSPTHIHVWNLDLELHHGPFGRVLLLARSGDPIAGTGFGCLASGSGEQPPRHEQHAALHLLKVHQTRARSGWGCASSVGGERSSPRKYPAPMGSHGGSTPFFHKPYVFSCVYPHVCPVHPGGEEAGVRCSC